jgi:hypothetical protein
MKRPTEGCTRCWCGAKYWDGFTCHSCGHPYHPDMDKDDER